MKPMRRFRGYAAAIAVAVAGSAEAQQTTAAAKATLEPAAMNALKSMGTYLRSLEAFQVLAATTDEDVLDDGQKDPYSGVTTILAQMPTRLRAEVTSDRASACTSTTAGASRCSRSG